MELGDQREAIQTDGDWWIVLVVDGFLWRQRCDVQAKNVCPCCDDWLSPTPKSHRGAEPPSRRSMKITSEGKKSSMKSSKIRH